MSRIQIYLHVTQNMTSNHGANIFEADSRKISPFIARVHKFSKHVSATLKF
jgi:hypothetical protein